MGGFMAFDIGCIECGEPSGIIGFYGTEDEAQAACAAAAERQQADWLGQHHLEVFAVDSRSKYAEDSP